MATKIDTPKARATILEYLASGPAVTYRIGKAIRRTTRQTYPVLRRMEQAGLVKRDDRMAGLWHRAPQST